jgi:hypothetical protein
MGEMEEGRVNRRALPASETAHQNRTGRNDLKTYASGPREFIIGIEEMQELRYSQTGILAPGTLKKEVDIKKERRR